MYHAMMKRKRKVTVIASKGRSFFYVNTGVHRKPKMPRDAKKPRTQIDKCSDGLLMRVTMKLECCFISCGEEPLIAEMNLPGVNALKAWCRLRKPRLLNYRQTDASIFLRYALRLSGS